MSEKDLIGALESIIVRCREGAKGTDWLPTIADIAERALKKAKSDPTTPSAGLDLEADARTVLKALANLHPSPLAMASIRLARHVLAHPAPAVGMEDARKALLAAKKFIENGVEFGYIRMPEADALDSAHEVMPLIRAALASLPSQPGAHPGAKVDPLAVVHGISIADRNAAWSRCKYWEASLRSPYNQGWEDALQLAYERLREFGWAQPGAQGGLTQKGGIE